MPDALHFSLRGLEALLDEATAKPALQGDRWSRSWDMLVEASPGAPAQAPLRQGRLTLTRRATLGGRVSMRVKARVGLARGQRQLVEAELEAEGPLGELQSYSASAVTLGQDGAPMESTRLDWAGTPAGVATSSWSLLDALEQVIDTGAEGVALSMLEDLTLPRHGLRLRFEELQLFGARVLMGFRLQGPGGLPRFYWLDEANRVALVCGDGRVLALRPDETPVPSNVEEGAAPTPPGQEGP